MLKQASNRLWFCHVH